MLKLKCPIVVKVLTGFLIVSTAQCLYAQGKTGGTAMDSPKDPQANQSHAASSGKVGSLYRFNINNINMPMDSKGVLAGVKVGEEGASAYYGGNSFLFSSGFFIGGLSGDNSEFAAGQATAALVENFVPGPAGMTADPRSQIYVLNSTDASFSQSWIDWKDAVALGADFYDGNGDGVYNPVDLNNNGIWDAGEDKPDILGDQMAWCVFNDGVPTDKRGIHFSGMNPQGIEIRQSVFGYAVKTAKGNVLFVRYRIKNTGLIAETLNNIMFGVWADPDLGDFADDLVGCDISRDAGFVYNDGSDKRYGDNPPCFLIDLLSGPVSYIAGETYQDNNGDGIYEQSTDTALDTAWSIRGPLLPRKAFPGAKNLGSTSFVHYQQGVPPVQDPSDFREALFSLNGLTQNGTELDPCNWALGKYYGSGNCSTLDNKFWFSGDPVAKSGWINTSPNDQRMMLSTGPFTLVKGRDVEIVVGYVVGQGTDALSSVTMAKQIDDSFAQEVFNSYWTSTDVVSVKEKNNSVIEKFAVEQNYPNPFNPSTTIRYTIPEKAYITLKVFDMLGREVAKLVDSYKEAGSYSVNFNADKQSSGLYIYTLSDGMRSVSKKMVFIK